MMRHQILKDHIARIANSIPSLCTKQAQILEPSKLDLEVSLLIPLSMCYPTLSLLLTDACICVSFTSQSYILSIIYISKNCFLTIRNSSYYFEPKRKINAYHMSKTVKKFINLSRKWLFVLSSFEVLGACVLFITGIIANPISSTTSWIIRLTVSI